MSSAENGTVRMPDVRNCLQEFIAHSLYYILMKSIIYILPFIFMIWNVNKKIYSIICLTSRTGKNFPSFAHKPRYLKK